MFRQVRSVAVALALGGSLASCSESTTGGDPSSAAPDASVPAVSEAQSDTSSIELIPVPFTEWEKRRGELVPNIVVVDLWATWCTPCLERFPHMVDMHQKYQGQGVEFVALSLDDREDESSIVFAREFLDKQNAQFANYLLDENVIDGMDMVGVQTIPAVNIYDRRGDLVVELNNNNPNRQFTDKDIDDAIQGLLARD